jgi:hypothetical protein
MTRKCYAAHTRPGSSYPPYINISGEGNEFTIVIRSAPDRFGACGRDAVIVLGPNEFRKFVEELNASMKGISNAKS